MLYIVTDIPDGKTQFYFREKRQSVPEGAAVELEPHVAAQYEATHPGLLQPTYLNAQGAPTAVRAKRGGRRKSALKAPAAKTNTAADGKSGN